MSNVNHVAGAAKRGAAGMAHAGVSISNPYPHVQTKHSHGETHNYPARSQVVLHGHAVHSSFAAATSVSNVFQAGSTFVDIRIPAGACQVVTGLTLQLDLRNGTQGLVDLPVGHFLFERVEVLAESGNVLVERLDPIPQLRAAEASVSSDAWSERLYTAFQSELLTPGEERTIFIPLYCAFTRNEIFLGGLRSDVYLRVWFAGATMFAGTAPPTLNSVAAIVSQRALSPGERSHLAQRYARESLDFRFQRPSFQSISQELAPNQRYVFQLSAIHGLVSQLVVYIRSAGQTEMPGQTLFGPLNSIELLDGSGANLMGGSALPIKFVSRIIEPKSSRNFRLHQRFGNWPNAVVLDFGDINADTEHGTVSGYLPFDGSYQLAITTGGPLPIAPHEIRVEALSAARLNLSGGVVKVFPS